MLWEDSGEKSGLRFQKRLLKNLGDYRLQNFAEVEGVEHHCRGPEDVEVTWARFLCVAPSGASSPCQGHPIYYVEATSRS